MNVTIPTQPDPVPLMSVFGWTIIQQHLGYTFDWQLPWADYKAGFGSIDADFWLGLEPYRLRVEVQQRSTNLWYSAEYWSFKIGDELNDKYRLQVAGYSGDAGDSLQYEGDYGNDDDDDDDDDDERLMGLCVEQYEGDHNGNLRFGRYYHNGMSFTTYDQDNDQDGVNCATGRGGGWWYNSCFWACLACHAAHFEWYSDVGYAVNSRMMVKRQ